MDVCKEGLLLRLVKHQSKEQYTYTLASTLEIQTTHQIHAQRLVLILLRDQINISFKIRK